MSQAVRTVTITARETAELIETREDPGVGPEEIAGPTVVTLVSPGTELNGYFVGNRFPRVPGYAAIFTVERVGAAVEDIRTGDLRYCMGPHRSWQKVEARQSLPLPPGLPPETAVFSRLMGVSMTSLVTTQARPPDIVLVTGLGPVGNLAAQNYRTCGYTVVACDPDAERRELALRLGIPRVLDAVPVGDTEFAGQVAMVLDCSGHEAAVVDGAKVVRKGGQVVLVGAPWARRTERFAHELLHTVFFHYVQIRTGWEWELPHHPEPFRPHSVFGNYRQAMAWLLDGKVRVDGLASTASPSEAQAVYNSLLDRTSECPTVLFDWTA